MAQFQYQRQITMDDAAVWLRGKLWMAVLTAALWAAALRWLRVPGGMGWAVLAGALQWIPLLGGPLSLSGPAMALSFDHAGWTRWLELLGAYATIQLLVALGIEPWLMKRKPRKPLWIPLLVPIALGMLWPFWSALLALPLLVLLYAFLSMYRAVSQPRTYMPREQSFNTGEDGIVLPPEKRP